MNACSVQLARTGTWAAEGDWDALKDMGKVVRALQKDSQQLGSAYALNKRDWDFEVFLEDQTGLQEASSATCDCTAGLIHG
jgi:hypothetical protein